MKAIHILVLFTLIFMGAVGSQYLINEKEEVITDMAVPVSHASFVLNLEGVTVYNDPVGEASLYDSLAKPDIILLSDIHKDHLDIQTLVGVVKEETVIIAPSSVLDLLPLELQEKTILMSNEDIHQVDQVSIEAIPMYNLPPSEDAYHVKGRGNGYLLDTGVLRIYIAGDTADIPEMRSLEDIDIAFIPMNLPYTMDIDVAADAVLDFAPAVVYPYHYRGENGLGDIEEFKALVDAGKKGIDVRLENWYP